MSEENVGFCGDENWKQLLPPGFRFAPTDVELLHYYLFRKVHGQYITPGVIHDADVYQSDPIHLPGVSGKEEEFTYFFTRRTQKYQKGLRSARNTKDEKGYWRMTSKQTPVNADENGVKWCVGKKNTLVYHIKTPKGQPDEKTNWIMHEFELDQELLSPSTSSHPAPQGKQFNDLIVCRIYQRHSKDEKEKADESTNSLIVSNNNGEPPKQTSPNKRFKPDKETFTTCNQQHDDVAPPMAMYSDVAPSMAMYSNNVYSNVAPPMAMYSNNVYGNLYEQQGAAIWYNTRITNELGETSGTSGVAGGSSDMIVYQEYDCVQNSQVAETQNSGLVDDQMKSEEYNPLEEPTRRDDDELNNNNMPLGYLPNDFYLDAISSGDWFYHLYCQPPPPSEQELLRFYLTSLGF